MDKRSLLIISALALPLVALVVLTQTGPSAPPGAPGVQNGAAAPAAKASPRPHVRYRRPPAPISLEEAKKRLSGRIAQLENMNTAQWQAELNRLPPRARRFRPTTREEALALNKQRLEVLHKMTPEEWKGQAIRTRNNPFAIPVSSPAAPGAKNKDLKPRGAVPKPAAKE